VKLRVIYDSIKSLRHIRKSGRFSKSWGLSASVSSLPLPLPPLSVFALAPFFARLKLRKSRSSDFFTGGANSRNICFGRTAKVFRESEDIAGNQEPREIIRENCSNIGILHNIFGAYI